MKISVVIPAFNSSGTLELCLKTLRQQTLPPDEILLVDDGSSDDTVRIAAPYARVIPNERRKGVGGARNTGGFDAQGEILVFSDSDCVFPPMWLENTMREFADPSVGAVAGGYSSHAGVDCFIGHFAFLEIRRRRRDFPPYVQTGVTNNFAVRAEVFRQVGGFPEELPTHEDMVFSAKVSRVSRIRWLPENGVGHQFRNSVTAYLRQQFAFAHDAVLVHWGMPILRQIPTHQGRKLLGEIILTALILPMCVSRFRRAFLWLAMVWLLNGAFLRDIRQRLGNTGVLKAMALLPVRNLVIILGLVRGLRTAMYGQNPLQAQNDLCLQLMSGETC
jgi:glycosyltransferase involved in cell wall biosynthesis